MLGTWNAAVADAITAVTDELPVPETRGALSTADAVPRTAVTDASPEICAYPTSTDSAAVAIEGV
jgi:hypothetical protein